MVKKKGLAVNKKGLTLKKLLHQSSHHNARTRKDALAGIKYLLIKHPTELWGYERTIVKLRERIRDTDKNVREALYRLLKTVVLPWSKEENQHGLVDLVVPYIFIAMASLSVELRLMAFKYFDLVVEYHPTTFSLYAEQILQRYEEILQNSQFYVGDKKNLKTALEGLVRCLSLLPGEKEKRYPWDPDLRGRRLLHGYYARDESEEPIGSNVVKKIKDLLPVLISCFQEFTPLIQNTQELDAKTFDCMLHILQSISLSFKLLVSGKYEDRRERENFPFVRPDTPFGRPDTDLSDEKIVSTILKKLLASFPLSRSNYASEKEEDKFLAMNSIITEIFFYLRNWICCHRDSLEKFIQVISRWTRRPDMLLKRFLEFIESALSGKAEGDNIFGSDATDAAESMNAAFAPAIASGIPWAAVLGNHDQESTLSREGLMKHIITLNHTFSKVNPSEAKLIDGFGNYNLEVAGVEGSNYENKSVLNLYFLDSGDYSKVPSIEGYDWIKPSQQSWFQQTSGKLKQLYMSEPHPQTTAAPGLAYFHIPLPEFASFDSSNFTGVQGDPISSASINSGFFTKLVAAGDVKAVFVGHDHLNDFCGKLTGIQLCYAGGFGYHAYGKIGWERRARVVVASLEKTKMGDWGGVELIKTWKRLDDQNLTYNGKLLLWNKSSSGNRGKQQDNGAWKP